MIEPHYPKAGRGRQPLGLEKMLRMAGGEDEPQHVIVDHLIQRVLQRVSKPLLLKLQLAGNLFVLLYEHAAAPLHKRGPADHSR